MCILMRPPLLSRSSTKPRGLKIRAYSHSRILASSYSDEVIVIEVKIRKNPYQISRISFGEIP